MDGESSYESDISEGWSLIDINSNEESLSANESPFELETVNLVESKYPQRETSDDLTVKDFVDKCKEAHENDFNLISSSNSNSSYVSEGFVHSCFKDLEAPSPSNKAKEDDGKNDSDIESIEILDVDGIYRDSEIDRIIDSHDSQTYQSDDEESVEENMKNGSRSNSSVAIKRKRRKFSSNSEEAVNSINREEKRPGKNDSEVLTSESSEVGSSTALFKGMNSHLVYKHHRNKVANAVLSLSMGIIFAGVVCIAIGHFLGVQDAAENKGGLLETLKKLQVENAALQSRLLHLNRVLLNIEANSKSGSPPDKDSCHEKPKVLTPGKTDETDLNCAASSGMGASFYYFEWLWKLQNLWWSENKAAENCVDFRQLGMYIQDRLNHLKTGKEGGIKLLEDADKKLSKVLQQIITRLSTSQEKIENLYDRLINLKTKLNHKLSKIQPDPKKNVEESRENFEKSTPVTEHDLQSLKWESGEEGRRNYGHPGPVVLYRFPQLEKYYETESRNLGKVESQKKVDVTNSTESSKREKVEVIGKKGKKRQKDESEKRKHKEGGKMNSKKAEWKEIEGKSEQKDKRHKRTLKKLNPKQIEKSNKKENRVFNSESVKLMFRTNLNKTDLEKAEPFKADEEVLKNKKKLKKFQKSKAKKMNLLKGKRDSYERKKNNRPCIGLDCSNSTGYWAFERAGGREKFRKHEKQGDWQFERAKGRKELRDEDYSVNWQFKRALGRENNRHGVRWPRGKHTRFNGKEFFHDRFSWI